MQKINTKRAARRGASFLTVAAILVSVTFLGVASSSAQESIPDGVECIRFDLAPTPDVFVPGGHDVVLLVLEDGTEVLFSDVVDDQRLESPSDSPIVTMYKCEITETGAVPEPEPTATPEPTPAPETTPAPEATPTAEPAPEATPTAEPAPTPTTQANPAPDVEVTPTPSVEVLGAVVVRDELPVTGSGSAEIALVAASLIGVGLLFRRFQAGLAT